jgi:hypothetical protein
MIERRVSSDFRGDPTLYYDYLIELISTTYASNVTQWSTCPSSDPSVYLACSRAWIEEDVDLNIASVYLDETGKRMSSTQPFTLGQTYFNTRMTIVEQRLIQGGLRLGTAINKVVQAQKDHHHREKHEHRCVGKHWLMSVVFLQFLLVICALAYCIKRRSFHRSPLSSSPANYPTINDVKA